MTTEAEVYEALRSYFSTEDKINCDRVTFFMVACGETADQLEIAATIIDPEMPDTIKGPPFYLPISQQVPIYVKDLINPILSASRNVAAISVAGVRELGMDKMKEIVDEAQDGDDYMRLVEEAIKSHGTG